jgi:hypothetical protein
MPKNNGQSTGLMVLRLITAAGLAVDAYVHFDLASQFDGNKGSGFISQGLLFRVEAVAAILAALLVLASSRRSLHVPALVVTVGGVAVVLLYRYVDVGAIGPVPDMYDPTWYTEKTVSVVAELVAALSAAALVFAPRRAPAVQNVSSRT